MRLIRPSLPDLDLDDWAGRPEPDRVRLMCESWAVQGFGAPLAAYLFYVLKIALWVWLWVVFVSRSPDVAGFADIATWWATPIAFQKAILWTMLFEVLGFGCGSGPLTGRYVPPVVAFTHWLRPGTIRLPAFPDRVPGTAGHRRGVVDIALYAAVLVLGVRALLSPTDLLGAATLAPIVVLLPLLGLRDKTVFLAARAEHYWTTLVVFVVAGGDVTVMLAGAMVVQLTIWWGAATSKLNHHFPSVITIMVSNSPFMPRFARRAMYRDHPRDLTASRVAVWLAHGGTAVEYTFPLLLAVADGGTPTTIGLVVMLAFHAFITSCFPMAVPIEWNVLFVYSMFVLFGVHAELSPLDVAGAPLLVILLAVGLLVGPVLGNLRPDLVSFLPSMRYYAGNWAASLWLFRSGVADRIDDAVRTTAPTVPRQLALLYDEDTIRAVLGKLRAFRSMHLHGRALNAVLPRVVGTDALALPLDDPGGYEVMEGEAMAGVLLGWNFGDGHLHHGQLLAAVQAECGFAPGDLRCLFLESQPMGRPWMHWRVVDAADGLLEEGRILARDLLAHQPVPEPGAVDVGALDRDTVDAPAP